MNPAVVTLVRMERGKARGGGSPGRGQESLREVGRETNDLGAAAQSVLTNPTTFDKVLHRLLGQHRIKLGNTGSYVFELPPAPSPPNRKILPDGVAANPMFDLAEGALPEGVSDTHTPATVS